MQGRARGRRRCRYGRCRVAPLIYLHSCRVPRAPAPLMSFSLRVAPHRRPRPPRHAPHTPRRDRDAGVHARRHTRRREGADAAQLEEAGAEIILGNTYHLTCGPASADRAPRRPAPVHRAGRGRSSPTAAGIRCSAWRRRTITEEGVTFRSHLDGSAARPDARAAVEIQAQLGSDIAMVLDECLAYPATHADAAASMTRTLRWARRGRDGSSACRTASDSDVAVTNPRSGTVRHRPGRRIPDLRERSVEAPSRSGSRRTRSAA